MLTESWYGEEIVKPSFRFLVITFYNRRLKKLRNFGESEKGNMQEHERVKQFQRISSIDYCHSVASRSQLVDVRVLLKKNK